jgi:hypothetical protein
LGVERKADGPYSEKKNCEIQKSNSKEGCGSKTAVLSMMMMMMMNTCT